MRFLNWRLLLVALCVSLMLTPTAVSAATNSSKPTLCQRAYGVRQAVIKKHGKRAAGRNICRFGVRATGASYRGTTLAKHGRPASVAEKARYLRALKQLNAPPPAYLAKVASPPVQPPAGTMSANYSPTGVAACIVQTESRGDPNARNGQYSGIAQWSQAIWERDGGKQYAATPTGASYQQQLQVLSNGIARHGTGDWSPYDGC